MVPVATTAEFAELVHNRAAILLAPFPDTFHEGLTTEVATCLAFFLEGLFDNVLGGDARMVGSRNPQHIAALHTPPTHEDVLDRVVQGMAHVKDSGDVWWGDYDAVGFAALGS